MTVPLLSLSITPIEVAPNDLCENATELPPTTNERVVQHVQSATWDPVHPPCFVTDTGYCLVAYDLHGSYGSLPPAGVWYSVVQSTAVTTWIIRLESLSSNADVTMNIFSGTCGHLLSLLWDHAWEVTTGVECSSGLCVSFESTVGEYYYVYVVATSSIWDENEMSSWSFEITATAVD